MPTRLVIPVFDNLGTAAPRAVPDRRPSDVGSRLHRTRDSRTGLGRALFRPIAVARLSRSRLQLAEAPRSVIQDWRRRRAPPLPNTGTMSRRLR